MLQVGTYLEGSRSGYKVVAYLGSGGLADVWEAQDRSGHRVALKYPTGVGAVALSLPQFAEEVRILRDLPPHPHCVRWVDEGMHDELPFYVMELIPGLRLDTFKPYKIERWILAKQLLSALGHCHRHGIIHLDCKPSNILCWSDAQDFPRLKLLDFGLAVDMRGARDLLTSASVVGTFNYMSPEQVLSRTDLDGRTDLFIAGMVLYELWMGTRFMRFHGAVDVMAFLTMRYVPPVPQTGNSALDQLIIRLMAKDRRHRPQSSEEALELLEDAWLSE